MERKIVEQFVLGKGFNAVCRDLGVGRNRAAHVREMAREYGYLDGSTPIQKPWPLLAQRPKNANWWTVLHQVRTYFERQ